MRANQLRLWLASMAYMPLCALRRIAVQHTQLAEATCGTIRLKLLEIGAGAHQRAAHQPKECVAIFVSILPAGMRNPG